VMINDVLPSWQVVREYTGDMQLSKQEVEGSQASLVSSEPSVRLLCFPASVVFNVLLSETERKTYRGVHMRRSWHAVLVVPRDYCEAFRPDVPKICADEVCRRNVLARCAGQTFRRDAPTRHAVET